MKKLLCMLLVLAMVFGMSTFASAASAPILLNTFKNVDLITDTNLLRITGNSGYGLADLNGNMLTGTIYSGFTRSGSLITCTRTDLEGKNVWGALDLNCQVVIPFQYGDIEVKNDWVIAVVLEDANASTYDYKSWSGDNYYIIANADIYNLTTGAMMTLTRDEFHEYYISSDIINISNRTDGTVTTYGSDMSVLATGGSSLYTDELATPEIDTFREDGRYGLVAADGTVIMPATYASIYSFTGDYAIAVSNDQQGLIDNQGNTIVAPAYEKIDRSYKLPTDEDGNSIGYVALGYVAIVLDGKLGYVDVNGNVTCQPTISESVFENNGVSATYEDLESNIHILAADGTDTVISGYTRVNAMNNSAGLYYYVANDNYSYGLIDCHGNEVFACNYSDINLSADGRYALVGINYENYELYDLGELTDVLSSIFTGSVAAPAEETSTEEAPAETVAPPAETSEPSAETTEVPTETTEAPAEEASADNSVATTLIESAKQLLNADPATNAAAIVSLLESALEQLPEGDPMSATLTSVITLLKADAVANASAALTLLG